MTNEIKEIINNLIEYRNSDYMCKQPEDCLTIEDVWLLLDYITNLQKENHRLKELCDKYEEEHSTTFEYWKRLVKEDYKSRNEKAIEYIETHKEPLHHYFDEPDCDYWIATNPQDIIDILRGDE